MHFSSYNNSSLFTYKCSTDLQRIVGKFELLGSAKFRTDNNNIQLINAMKNIIIEFQAMLPL